MLSPVLRTCRKLRQIALSHASLWKTVSSSSQYRLPALPLYGADSSAVPLIAIIDGCDHDSLLGDSGAMDVSRIQELHVLNLRLFRKRDDVAELRRRFRGVELSCLESLSISSFVATGEEEPISLEEAPRLRHLVLQSVTYLPQNRFPNLTHLALEGVCEHERHATTAHFLSRCPNLENIAINYADNDEAMSVPPPLSQPLALNRLQRISLQLPNILDKLGEFYLSLFPIRTGQTLPIALQVLNHHWYDMHHDVEALLKDATGGAASHLSFSMSPLPDRSSLNILFFAITAAGPQGTFHIATVPFYDYDSSLPGPDWDFNQSATLKSILGRGLCLPAVRELWISGVHPEVDRHTHIAAAFKTAIAGLSALETIVLVEPVQGYPPSGSTLGLCPDALDAGAGGSEPRSAPPPNLRTLRLVYGDGGTHWLRDWDGDVNELDLGRLLAELETGAYAYFDTLVLEMRPWLDVGSEDLQRLKGHFATVERRYYVDRTPTMPLPDYCVEPHGGSGGTRSWLGSLW